MQNQVRQARKRKGIRQTQLAEMAGVSQCTISKIEQESDPSYPDVIIAIRIAVILGVTVEDLWLGAATRGNRNEKVQ